MIELVFLLMGIFLFLILLFFQGSGFDFTAVSQTLSEAAESLVNILRQAGHGQAAFAALQRAAVPLGSLLLGTDPDLRAAMRQRCATTCQAGLEKNPFFLTQPSGFFWGFLGFLYLCPEERVSRILFGAFRL
jgi:hypothetical protein